MVSGYRVVYEHFQHWMFLLSYEFHIIVYDWFKTIYYFVLFIYGVLYLSYQKSVTNSHFKKS